MADGEKKKENGDVARLVLRIDKSFVTALIALMGSAGAGAYAHFTDPGEDLTAVGQGVIDSASTVQKLTELNGKLVITLQRKDQEIDELYETTDWLIGAVKEFGKKHPQTWRSIRREAPMSVPLEEGEAHVASRSSDEEEPPEQLYEEFIEDAPPEALSFPKIQEILRRRRQP